MRTTKQAPLDVTRSAATQPYRTTRAAQMVARSIRVYERNGRTTTIRPIVDVLSPRALALLAV